MILSRKATGNNKRFNTSKHRDGTIGSSYLHGLLMVLMIRSATVHLGHRTIVTGATHVITTAGPDSLQKGHSVTLWTEDVN